MKQMKAEYKNRNKNSGQKMASVKSLSRSLRSLLRFACVFAVIVTAIPQTAFAKSICLLAVQDACVLKTDYRGLKVQVDEHGKVVVIFGNSKDDFSHAEAYVNVRDDLARLEKSNEIEAEESSRIEADLVKYDGANYSIPDASELREALGFPETTTIAPEDYLDLIRVHMQLVLSLSPSAAGYLSDLLGVEVVEPVVPKTPTPGSTSPVTPIPANLPTPEAAPFVGPLPAPEIATPSVIAPPAPGVSPLPKFLEVPTQPTTPSRN